jgi:hypothetical protein
VNHAVTTEPRTEPRAEPAAGRPGRHRRAPEERSSYREVFAIREFRALWTAQVLSFAGDQFAQAAIAILGIPPDPLGVPDRSPTR